MRNYSYKNEWKKLLTPEIVAMIAKIHEYKGEQNNFLGATKDTLTHLVHREVGFDFWCANYHRNALPQYRNHGSIRRPLSPLLR